MKKVQVLEGVAGSAWLSSLSDEDESDESDGVAWPECISFINNI